MAEIYNTEQLELFINDINNENDAHIQTTENDHTTHIYDTELCGEYIFDNNEDYELHLNRMLSYKDHGQRLRMIHEQVILDICNYEMKCENAVVYIMPHTTESWSHVTKGRSIMQKQREHNNGIGDAVIYGTITKRFPIDKDATIYVIDWNITEFRVLGIGEINNHRNIGNEHGRNKNGDPIQLYCPDEYGNCAYSHLNRHTYKGQSWVPREQIDARFAPYIYYIDSLGKQLVKGPSCKTLNIIKLPVSCMIQFVLRFISGNRITSILDICLQILKKK